MTPDTIPELIAWTAGTGSAALAAGALIVGPAVQRWRLRRLRRRLAAMSFQPDVPLPELADLLAQVPPRPGRDL